ncbi:uncharacterized protein LY79DRAFT_706727 [Colletotrichum navitas]|uniref:Uncharacterized protein n=1 Tax=Colletotrichum navitas TaxID=681940 RepID=A0AAD8PQE8_9PEZI|nr:uncharacterized protein LY79DRAFT_706727 [Colletotrichum navitas]KAK1574083.1 hypothetical protein LY79DRAFT_706727 [Colletotrichum navitas]
MDPSARASQPGREVRNTYDTDTVVVDSRTGHWTAPFHDGSGHSYAAISEPNGAFVGNNKASNTAGINEAYEGRHDGLNSPFGVSQLWTKPTEALPEIPQTEVFYIGSPDNILGVNWREGFSRGGLPDSVSEGGYTLSNTGTQIAAYWPSTLLQASNGDVVEVFYEYKAPKFQEQTAVGITASPGSALVILPREVIRSAGERTTSSSARIIYRDTDGRLQNYDRSSGGQKVTSSGQLLGTVDSNFTMAGFAVARLDSGSGGSGALNTWILYQDSKTGKISYLYEDDTTGWKGPETDAVFEGANNPTQLACVTASSAKVPQVPLVASHDLSHCSF